MIKLFIGPDSSKRPAPPPEPRRCPRCGSTSLRPAFKAHPGKHVIRTHDDRLSCRACGYQLYNAAP